MIGNLVCKRNKRGTRKRKRIWSFASRPTLELRNLRLGNTVQETFRLRSGNTVERLWIQNISRFVYAFSWTYVLLAGVN